MTDRKVMRQALETIDWLRHHLTQHHQCLHMSPDSSGIPAWVAKTESALRAALAEPEPRCGCHKCNEGVTINGIPFALTRMILCPTCGNKRCPHASDHRLACTYSNEPGQAGSVYPAPADPASAVDAAMAKERGDGN